MTRNNELPFIERIIRESGKLILSSFGGQIVTKQKSEKSQVVTELDVASEKLLIAAISDEYPQSSIVAEESGFVQKDPEDLWIIDPIDGTSNFAHGIPWFGIMVAHVVKGEAITAGIYLPVSDEMYAAAKGKGAFKNGEQMNVVKHASLLDVLVSYGTDGSEKSFTPDVKGKLYTALLSKVLNVRCTNSAVDYAYAAEGKIGGLINLENRIWDIAPITLIASEAGNVVTDVLGNPVDLHIDKESIAKNFTLLLAQPILHAELLAVIRSLLK